MDRRKELMAEIMEINKSNLSVSEKSSKIIFLSRELGKIILEERINIK